MNWASRLMGRPERKALGGGRPWAIAQPPGGEPPATYEGQVRAAWRNPVALRAVRLVAEGLSSVTLQAGGMGHDAIRLLPPALLEAVATHMLLHGNAFLETGLDLGGLPAELWVLRPERMRLETDANGWPLAWLHQVGGRLQRHPAQGDAQMPGLLHLKAFDPLDDHLGAGSVAAASEAIALLQAAGRWNRSLVANAARPSGALLLDGEDGPLSAEQFGRLREEIEAGFQGAHNAGRPMLLEGGLRWQPLSLTPAEMDFQRAREAASREVALAFGVPPMLLGLPGDSTHANYAEANVALWRLTILPLLNRILDGVSRHLSLWWPGLRLEPDLDLVPALWADRERLWRHVLASGAPDLQRANMPVGWAWPAWDVLQLEDYGFVTAGDEAGMARARAAADAALGYPAAAQHYLAGFVLQPEEAGREWPLVAGAARAAVGRSVAEVFLWAWPQVARDGFVWLSIRDFDGTGGDAVQAFHDVRFPLELGFDAVGGPEFATQVALLASGHEQRNVQWAQARLSYDAGLGVRSEADLVELVAFFRARRGRGFGFRLRDPLDFSSSPTGDVPSAEDQLLGVGDGLTLRFPLVKRYGFAGAEEVRRITRPEAGTVLVSVAGVPAGGWQLADGGVIELTDPPAVGAEVRAGFRFDVPVRFAADRLEVSLSGVRSGEAPSVPLVEIRE